MKLYTKEDIEAIGQWAKQWDLYELDKENNYKPPMFKEFIESLTQIELPSDDEIEELATDGRKNDSDYNNGFIQGAIWMKEQILNQNK